MAQHSEEIGISIGTRPPVYVSPIRPKFFTVFSAVIVFVIEGKKIYANLSATLTGWLVVASVMHQRF